MYVVAITNYTISQSTAEEYFYGPNSYIFEAFDNEKWYLLDNVTSTDLNSSGKTLTRPVQMTGIFSKFRLTQTAKNTGKGNEFRVCNFDIFGSIHRKYRLTCPQRKIEKLKMALF